MRKFFGLLLVLSLATVAQGELLFKSLSVTATSQTFLLPKPSEGLGLCNEGANEAYYRVFIEGEATAAATTSWHKLPAGTAAAPYCVSFSKPGTVPTPIAAVSIVCDTAETATVLVQYW